MSDSKPQTGPEPVDDPTIIDWSERQAKAALPFKVADGRPVNPQAPTGVERGRGGLWLWGENLCADAVLFLNDSHDLRWLAMIERGDGHGWALPGGTVDPGEDPVAAAVRELQEETGFNGAAYDWEPLPARQVPDPRASDEAWTVTIPSRTHIGRYLRGFFPAIEGADDARRAEWVPAGSYADLVSHLSGEYGGRVCLAHIEMLRELLDGGAR